MTRWQTSRVVNGQLRFDSPEGFDQARRSGFFFLEIPGDLDVSSGDDFAANFHLAPDAAPVPGSAGFRRFTAASLGPRQGYFCRDADQTEQFFLERAHWPSVFPSPLAFQADRMRRLGIDVLRSVLEDLAVPRSLWDTGTGQATAGGGAYHLTFNHFRSHVSARGLNVHKDSGWVTVLRSTRSGLEVESDMGWLPIDPLPNHFIVNFGCAMEILTRSTASPVAAVAHRVQQQTGRPDGVDRVSYGLFVDSALPDDGATRLYEYLPPNELIDRGNPAEFVDRIVQRTYEREGIGLY